MRRPYIFFAICLVLCLLQGCPDPSTIEVDAPRNLSLTDVTSDSMVFTWDLVYGANSYWIYLNTSNNFSTATKLGYSSTTGVEITGLNSSTTYYCWVTAKTITGTSSESESCNAKTLIGSPKTLTATVSGSSISLSWTAVTGATLYDIYHSTSSTINSSTLLASVNATSYTYSSASDGTHYFWLYAKNATSKSSSYAVANSRIGFSITDYKNTWESLSSYGSLSLSGLNGNIVSIVKINTDDSKSYKTTDSKISEKSVKQITNTKGYPVLSLRQDSTNGIISKSLLNENDISSKLKPSVIKHEVPKRITEFNNTVHTKDGYYSTNIRSLTSNGRASYSVGDTRKFWVDDNSGDFYQQDTHLRATGTYCNIWVADENFEDLSKSNRDNKVTTQNAKDLATKFDELYLDETNLFGESYKDVYPNGVSGLIDPSDKISILITDLYDDYSVSQESGVVGYFWSKDFYFDNSTSNSYQELRSNEDEMFYIDSLFLDAYPQVTESTLAHEFQHMLNFIHKNIKYSLNLSTWYTEMLSMLCEDVLQGTIGCSDEDSPKSRLSIFNYGYSINGLEKWLDDDDVYYSYAMAYAFGAFLARNYGGPNLINEIATNGYVDMNSIIKAIETVTGEIKTVSDLLIEFTHACCYPDAPKNYSSVPHLNKEISGTVNKTNYTFKAIRLADYPVTVSGKTYFGPYSRDANSTYYLQPLGFGISNLGSKMGTYFFDYTQSTSLEEYYCVE